MTAIIEISTEKKTVNIVTKLDRFGDVTLNAVQTARVRNTLRTSAGAMSSTGFVIRDDRANLRLERREAKKLVKMEITDCLDAWN